MARLLTTWGLLVAVVAFAQASSSADEVYEQGKVLYDAKDYAGALQKFDEAARLEPAKARWHYNRGLALRKLGNDEAARAAFNESLRLDPTYKRAEIDEKLRKLTPAVASGSGSLVIGVLTLVSICLPFVLFFGAVVFRISRFVKREDLRVAAGKPQPDVELERYRSALGPLGARLAKVEHAMSLGEDAEARPHLDRASAAYRELRRLVRSTSVTAEDLSSTRLRLEDGLDAAEKRLRERHGAAFDVARGPRVGCFFCARPLPTPEATQVVSLRVGARTVDVPSCRACASKAQSGASMDVLVVNTPHGSVHWAAAEKADPYSLAYSEQRTAREVKASSLRRQADGLVELSSLAGAVAAGAAVAYVLDLDELAAADAATEAAEAAAESARWSRTSTSTSSWNDHS